MHDLEYSCHPALETVTHSCPQAPSLCYFHHSQYMRPTAAPSLEPGRPRSSRNYWGWIQGMHRIVLGTPQASPGLPQLHQLLLTLDTCKHKTSWSGNCLTSTVSLTHIHSHSQCLLFTINYFLKWCPGKLSQAQSQWWIFCVLSWSLHGNTWGSWGWSFSPIAGVRAGVV